jgi:hypothetical protein
VSTEQAKEQYPELEIVKPYLRFTPLALEETSAGKAKANGKTSSSA